MLLSARPLIAVADVNNFSYCQQLEMTEGDQTDLYFQLVDLTKDLSSQGWRPGGRRYVAAAGATLAVVLVNIDDAKKVSRSATQPFPTTDPSIWKVTVTGVDKVRGTVALQLTLTEGAVKTYGRLDKFLLVHNQGML